MADLVVPGIRDEVSLAFDGLMDRWRGLPIPVVLTNLLSLAPATALPHLAAQFHMLDGVAWRKAGSDEERRGLIGAAIYRHGLKGTLAGFRLAAGDAGAVLERAIVPPAKIYAGASLTIAERNAFVARYPQLRIYPQRLSGRRVGAMLTGLHAGWKIHPVQTDAPLRLAPQAYLYRDGVETPLQTTMRAMVDVPTAAVYTEVCQPGVAGRGGFCGHPVAWMIKSDAARRIYRVSIDKPYIEQVEVLRQVTVSPGLVPLTVRYDWTAGTGMATGVHAGRYTCHHLAPSTARERIYKRVWLFDPDIDVTRRVAGMHCNGGILGMPAHHAEILVRINGKTQARAARRYVQGYLCAADQTTLMDTLEAMRQVMRASDVIGIDTAVIAPMMAGEQYRAGSRISGSWN